MSSKIKDYCKQLDKQKPGYEALGDLIINVNQGIVKVTKSGVMVYIRETKDFYLLRKINYHKIKIKSASEDEIEKHYSKTIVIRKTSEFLKNL
jgi:hypothetical protein